MRTLGFSIVLAAMLAATVKADFISSQVICSVNAGTATGTNFCSIAGDFGTLATASVNAFFTLPTSPGPLSLAVSGQGIARGYFEGTNNNRGAFFRESVSIQLTLDTPGSPRPGFFLITGRPSAIVGVDTLYGETLSLEKSGELIFREWNLIRGLPLRPLPITLGEPFTFTYTEGMSCDDGTSLFCPGNNTVSSQYEFHLYESDGVTPVLITLAAPEPSSATLLFLPLTALAVFVWGRLEIRGDWQSANRPPRHLFVSKRHHRIDLNRSPRGNVNRYPGRQH